MSDLITTFQMLRYLVNNASFKSAASVTPSNTEDLSETASALWIGTTGNIKVDLEGAQGITFNAVPVGLLRARVKRVYATGTSASNIVALW